MSPAAAHFTPDEEVGVRLFQTMAGLFRHVTGELHPIPPPLGPDFEYDGHSPLFWGRHGVGPLEVVWDTNLLIDYLQHGRDLWLQQDTLDGSESHYEELEALQFVIGLWVIRDIRFHLPARVLDDAKRRLTEQRRWERLAAVDRFAQALAVIGHGYEEPEDDGLPWLPEAHLDFALSHISGDMDRALVRDAVDLRAHVFLTRDAQVLACAEHLKAFGLLIASPGDLLEELVSCGAFHCFHGGDYAYWPFPDLARVSCLLGALPPACSP